MANAGGAERAASRAGFEDILVAKRLDKTGPQLQKAVATGQIFPTVKIELYRAVGDAGARVLNYELTNARVTSYNVGTTGQSELTPSGLPRIELGGPTVAFAWPVEEVSLSYEKIKVTYYQYDQFGALVGTTEFRWDVKRNMEY